MAGPSWLVDPKRIATKIRSASGASDPGQINWKSNPTKSCPNCQYVIDNSDVSQVWPGLPRGVKFDPSDQEIIWHLLSKAGAKDIKPHPFIDEFIPTVEEDDGICYTHPQNLPGVKQDGTVSHFFHRAVKAYNTGTRKRRKIQGDDYADVRWHKTGRTKPVHLDGVQKGCKKIMVLYVCPVKGGKAEKTNWVMHQYHLGTGEDEQDGEYVVSKIFYQQQQIKLNERSEGDKDHPETTEISIIKVDPVTPKSVIPEPPRAENRTPDRVPVHDSPLLTLVQHQDEQLMLTELDANNSELHGEHKSDTKWWENDVECRTPDHVPVYDLTLSSVVQHQDEQQMLTDLDANNSEIHGEHKSSEDPSETKWWENESQFLLSSQQLVEGLSLCDELLQSQSPNRDDNGNIQHKNNKILLSDYARLGPEDLKRDLEECQKLAIDPANIELDTPPDFRLSQLEFESQESYIAFGEAYTQVGRWID